MSGVDHEVEVGQRFSQPVDTAESADAHLSLGHPWSGDPAGQ